MTSTDAIAEAMSRLASLPGIPAGDDGKDEIARALDEHCRSDDHLARTVTSLWDAPRLTDDGHVRLLTPHEVGLVAAATPVVEIAAGGLPKGCKRCSFGDDAHVMSVNPDGSLKLRGGYTSAERCDCALGQYWARLDRDRKIAKAAK